MSKNDHQNRNPSVATPPPAAGPTTESPAQGKDGEGKQVLDAKAALEGHEPIGGNIEIHTDSHKIDEEHFVDANGQRILFKDGKPIHQDAVFNVQSVQQSGYWKAGQKFGVIPSEIVFKSLSADQQRALLSAHPSALVVTRKS